MHTIMSSTLTLNQLNLDALHALYTHESIVLLLSFIDICDLAWQSTRDNLIISAHFFSDIAFLIVLASILSFCLNVDKYIHDSCEHRNT